VHGSSVAIALQRGAFGFSYINFHINFYSHYVTGHQVDPSDVANHQPGTVDRSCSAAIDAAAAAAAAAACAELNACFNISLQSVSTRK